MDRISMLVKKVYGCQKSKVLCTREFAVQRCALVCTCAHPLRLKTRARRRVRERALLWGPYLKPELFAIANADGLATASCCIVRV